jgi:hypothetical protein
MSSTRLLGWFASLLLPFAAIAQPAGTASAPSPGTAFTPAHFTPGTKTNAVIHIMLDGLRWQEVFRGPDESLMNKENKIENIDKFKADYLRATPDESRAALMPFFWSVIATQGQLLGNFDKHCDMHVTNPFRVSYPGYSETLCGFVDEKIENNRKTPNPNVTMYEWLHAKPAFKGRIAAFSTWDVFPFIFNQPRAGFPVDDGMGDITFGTLTPTIQTINRLRRETPYRWGGSPFDSMTFIPALEWLKANKPRLMFLGLGEPDEWGHEGDYPHYLRAIQRCDGYIRELWETLQAMPEYKGVTTLIIHCDHGRGDTRGEGEGGKRDWRNHGSKHPGSEQIWCAILGPDTPALGERHDLPEGKCFTQSQIAATIAALLGEDYHAAEPRSGGALQGVVGERP